jgi:hypothetical protein
MMKNAFALFAFLLIYGCTLGQDFKLLWYKGKKINDSTLVTAGGNRVIYHSASGRVRVQFTGTGSISSTIINGVKNAPGRKRQILQTLTSGPMGRTNISAAIQASDEVDKADQRMLRHVDGPGELELGDAEGGSGKELPTWLRNHYDDVISYVLSVKGKEPGDAPRPPQSDFSYCAPCRDKNDKAREKEVDDYISRYFTEDREHIQKALRVIRYFQYRQSKKLPYDSVAASTMEPRMTQALAEIADYMQKKAIKVWNQYKSDGPSLPFMAELFVSVRRNLELLGMSTRQDFPPSSEVFSHTMTGISKHLSKALQEKNYPVLLNVRWIIALYRQAELLGVSDVTAEKPLHEYLSATRFEMKMDATARIGGNGISQFAKITGSNFYRAIPDTQCILRWHLISPDTTKMVYKLEDVGMEAPGSSMSYVGTRKWKAAPANITLDFCHPERDTLLLNGFQPDGKENWVMANITQELPIVTSLFGNSFMDEKRVREMAADKGLGERLKKEMMDEYEKHIAPYKHLMDKDPATLTAAEQEQLRKVVTASQEIRNKVNMPSPFGYLLKGRLKNSDKTVFDEQIDGKVLFPRNTAIQEAIMRVRIDHAPN